MTDKIKTGNDGEQIAADYLIDKGYELIEKNYRYRHSQIDLIVKIDIFLVFVEVKTRRSTRFGEPEVFVSKRQEEKIRQGAVEYILKTDWHGPIRFDIISIVMGDTVTVTHLEDAIH